MKIDFNKLEEIPNQNYKDGEGVTKIRSYSDGFNKIMLGYLEPGCSIGYHVQDNSSEVIFILKGLAHCRFDDEDINLSEGQCLYCPPGHSHSLGNASSNETLEYYAVVNSLPDIGLLKSFLL